MGPRTGTWPRSGRTPGPNPGLSWPSAPGREDESGAEEWFNAISAYVSRCLTCDELAATGDPRVTGDGEEFDSFEYIGGAPEFPGLDESVEEETSDEEYAEESDETMEEEASEEEETWENDDSEGPNETV